MIKILKKKEAVTKVELIRAIELAILYLKGQGRLSNRESIKAFQALITKAKGDL